MSESGGGVAAEIGSARWALEATTDSVILLDGELRIVYVNARTAALNGTTPDALIGRRHGEVWPQAAGTEVERRYREVLASGAAQTFVYHYPTGERPERWHEIYAYPHAGGVAVFYRDVTAAWQREVAAHVERERLERSIQAAGIGVWSRDLTDPQEPPHWSPTMRAHYGLSETEPVDGDTFDRCVHPDDRARSLRAYRQAIAEGTPYDAVYRTVGRDGTVRSVHARGRASYTADGRPFRFDGFTLDVTERLHTERRLREARAHLTAVLASADIAAWVLDLREETISGDAKLMAMFGLEGLGGGALPMKLFTDRIHPDDLPRVASSLDRALEQDAPWSAEYRIVYNETCRWVNARGIPLRDEAGTAGVSGVDVDITALKQAEERERETAERLRRAERRQRFRVDLMDALREIGDEREIVSVACRMVGEFLGVSRTTYGLVDREAGSVEASTPYYDGVAPVEGVFRLATFGAGMIHEYEKGRPFAVTNTATNPVTRDAYASSFAPLNVRSFVVVPLFRRGTLRATFTVHDKNVRHWTPEEIELLENVAHRTWSTLERARAEDELRGLNAELDQRVQQRTLELQQANDELQAFTSAVSHDLRGPLRNIHGMGKMLLEDAADRLTDDDRRLLERQAHNAMRVAKMVDDLLNLSRLGREPLDRQPFDMSALAASVRDDFLARETHAGVQIEIAPELQATGDRRLVKFVLMNLLENACKFSPAGGTVRVGRDPDGAFFVSDEGVGFDMAHAAKLFQPFERLVSEKEFPGTGIGLANVHRIVTRHGGRVWADARSSEGATFRFTLGPPPMEIQ